MSIETNSNDERTNEIRETFEQLSRIDWQDYVQLCADEHEQAAHDEMERSGMGVSEWIERFHTARALCA
jgi:hypothetical protein